MQYDVAISGAGPAGSTTALVLARLGARVIVLDRATFPRDKPCAEYLSPEVNVLLGDLGLAELVEIAEARRLRGFRIFAHDGRSFTGTFAANSGAFFERSYGLAVPRTLFDFALVTAAVKAGAELREATRVTGVSADDRGICLRASRGNAEEIVRASYVIAADGLRSMIARSLGLMVPRRPYRIALVTHMAGVEDLDEYGEMHVSPQGGYCGLAAFGDGSSGVSMVIDASTGQRIGKDREAFLRAALDTYPNLSRRVRNTHLCKPLLITSGLSQHVRHPIGPRTALVGDASGYYDPFTGEGIYRAIASARLAAGRMAEALTTGDHCSALLYYEQDMRRAFRGKHSLERIIDVVVHHPLLFAYVARRLRQSPRLADTLVGVTGDFLSPWAVLNPVYLTRLLT